MTTLVTEELVPVPQSLPSATASSGGDGREVEGFFFAGRPGGLAVGLDGTVFVSDTASGTIWRLAPGGDGADAAGPIDEVQRGIGRQMLTPAGLALGPDGTLFVADTTGHRVWAVSPEGGLRPVAGSVYGYGDGPGAEARFRFPADVAVGPDGTCYVADTGNDRIRTISPEGRVETLAGSNYDHGDGRGPAARFRRPTALDVDAAGTCYVADTGNHAIRRISPEGEVATLAGAPPGGDADGVGAEVGLHWPSALALGPGGFLWVADYGNGALRRIGVTGESTTRLRLEGRRWPVAVALAPDGGVLVAIAALDEGRRSWGQLISVTAEA